MGSCRVHIISNVLSRTSHQSGPGLFFADSWTSSKPASTDATLETAYLKTILIIGLISLLVIEQPVYGQFRGLQVGF